MKGKIISSLFSILLILSALSALNFVSAVYYVNEPTQAGAPGYWVCDNVYENCEFGVVTSCLCGTINCDRVNTCESVQTGAKSDTGLLGPAGYPFFLANGYCQSNVHPYNMIGFQKVDTCTPACVPSWTNVGSCSAICGGGTQSQTDGCGNSRVIACNTQSCVNPTIPTITIVSPQNIVYNINTINFVVTSNQQIVSWKYNLNNAGNSSSLSSLPSTINALNGTNTLVVYGTNANGTGMASVSFFVNSSTVCNSTYSNWGTCSVSCGGGIQTRVNGCGNTQTQACNTQSCQNNLTVPTLTVISPVNNGVYNTTNILLNVIANQNIILWLYNLNNNGNISFIPGTFYNLLLINGTNHIVFYGINANGTGTASVNFVFNSSSNQTNPSCTPSQTCQGWSSCSNNHKTRTCTTINSDCSSSSSLETKSCSNNNEVPCTNSTLLDVPTYNPDENQEIISLTSSLSEQNSTIMLSAKQTRHYNYNSWLYWIVVAVLALLIIIILVYILRFA